ncbi:MAG TPA: sigma-70 family RNA polymerase sigma factor [Gemmataceae bacterium]|nr:sigma-70 family RNA polymerase sigma factor [Gemmataceae bacterium]
MSTSLDALLLHWNRCVASTLSDGDLVRSYLHNHAEEPFRLLVERHGRMVLGVCRHWLGDPHAAEDAFQATFLLLARRASSIRRPESVAAWLHRTAIRICTKARRAEIRRRQREVPFSACVPSEDSCSTSNATSDVLLALEEEVERLPERYRTPLLLCYWQGVTQAEAARYLGCSEGSIKARLERGRKRLAQRLTQRGLAPNAILVAPLAAAMVSRELLARTVALAPEGAAVPTAVAMLVKGMPTVLGSWSWYAVAALVAAATLIAGAGAARTLQRGEAPPQLAGAKEQKQAAASDEEDVSQVRIEGIVVDQAGQPVAGAVVGLLKSGGANESKPVLTSSEGTFRLMLKEPSLRYLTVGASAERGTKQGIADLNDDALPLGRTAVVRIVLKPSRSLTVRVCDNRKAPVHAATVGVFDDDRHLLTSAETDAQGQTVLLLPVDARVFQVVALKSGIGMDYFENYRSWPDRAQATLPKRVDLTLDGARTVRVRATDSVNRDLPGIDLIPWSIQKKGKLHYVNLSGGLLRSVVAHTDERGVAVFDWLPRQIVDGATILNRNFAYHLPDSPHFDPSRPDAPLVARLFRNVAITGKVTRPDGKPAGGILLQAEGRGNTNHYCRELARTRADGTYSLLVYPDQSYLIAVTDDRWAASAKTGLIAREGKPLQNIDFSLHEGTLLQGKLTIGRGKKPAAKQTITLMQEGSALPAEFKEHWATSQEELVRWAATDKDGRYSIRVGPGTYKIWGPETDPRDARRLVVKEEKIVTKDFHIHRLARGPLEGVVFARTVDGKPVAGAIVKGESVKWSGHVGFEAIADDKGCFRSERWHDDMYLYVRDPKGTLATVASIGANDEKVTIVLFPAGKIHGRIVDKNGKPLAGLRVTCSQRIGPNGPNGNPRDRVFVQEITDCNGGFTFGGILPAADCSLDAYDAESSQHLQKVSMKGTETLDLGDLKFDAKKK